MRSPGVILTNMLHTRESVLQRVTDEFEALEAAIANLGKEDWALHLGKREGKDPWNVKDSLAHITYWKANAVRSLRGERRKKGEAPLPKSITESNHVIYEELKDRSLSDVLAWHRKVQEELVAALKEAPDTLFSKRERSPVWPFDAAGHSTEHRVKDIEKLFDKSRR